MKKLFGVLLAIAMISVFALSAAAEINDGIISYYSFDSDAYDALDQNNLELKRDDQIVKEGAACGDGYVVINGESDVLALIGTEAFGPFFDNGKMTIAAWVKPNYAEEGLQTLIGFGTGGNYDYFRLFINANMDRMTFYFQSTNEHYRNVNTDTNVLHDGDWHHIAIVAAEGESPLFYIDGQAYDENTFATIPEGKFIGDSTGYFVLGAMNDLKVDLYTGGIDDLRIYGRDLSDDEIIELYKMKGTTPATPEPSSPLTESQQEETDPPATEPKQETTDKETEKSATPTTGKQAEPGTDEPAESGNKTGLIIGIVAAAVVIAAIVVVLIVKKKK